MLTSKNETYQAVVYKRKTNSFEYETTPSFSFYCRPASELERKQYFATSGLMTTSDGIMLFATRLDEEIKVDDRVVFNGTSKLVDSVGVYIENNRIVNASLFKPTIITKNAPKGITLKWYKALWHKMLGVTSILFLK